MSPDYRKIAGIFFQKCHRFAVKPKDNCSSSIYICTEPGGLLGGKRGQCPLNTAAAATAAVAIHDNDAVHYFHQ